MDKQSEKNTENIYAYALYSVTGLGRKTLLAAWKKVGSTKTLYEMNERQLGELMKKQQTEELLKYRSENKIEKICLELSRLKQQNIHFTFYGDEDFPTQLRKIPDPPFALFIKGDYRPKQDICVGIIGARLCSEYGRYCAREYAKALAQAGVTVISGMARGVDGISQKAALERGGKSIGVLGCGVDICYPAENEKVYEMLCKQGSLISEYMPGTKPQARMFPARNRIISGLSHALLVIEAREKSGTLITVDAALEQGKEVYVLPGRVTDSLSFGCNQLIKQGASMTLSPAELITELFENTDLPPYQNFSSLKEKISDQLTEKEKQVYITLSYEPVSLEEIAQRNTELSIGEISSLILDLYSRALIVCQDSRYSIRSEQ